jgi:AcrR family transcriptional regulator
MPVTKPKSADRRPQPNPERRNADTHAAVLEAAEKLLRKHGYAGVTMDSLAREVGCSNKTLYRWWPTKAAVFIELYNHLGEKVLGPIDTGSFEKDVIKLMTSLARLFRDTAAGMAMRGMIAEAQGNAVAAEHFRDVFMKGRREVPRAFIRKAIERGELPRDADIETIIDLTGGPLWYRLLLGHLPLTDAFAQQCARVVLNGLQTS